MTDYLVLAVKVLADSPQYDLSYWTHLCFRQTLAIEGYRSFLF
ncbi:MAG: hypothetical protein QOJ84_4680 [Bradyrhizobium sp.]|jgi:hypothetical protein|nr:hypothetical protein [Bradyrhizobium sp.]